MIYIINLAFEILIIMIFIRVILSWINHNPYNPIIKFIYDITNPILIPVQNAISPVGGIDISPIIIIFALQIIKRIIIKILLSF